MCQGYNAHTKTQRNSGTSRETRNNKALCNRHRAEERTRKRNMRRRNQKNISPDEDWELVGIDFHFPEIFCTQ